MQSLVIFLLHTFGKKTSKLEIGALQKKNAESVLLDCWFSRSHFFLPGCTVRSGNFEEKLWCQNGKYKMLYFEDLSENNVGATLLQSKNLT